MRSSDNSVDNSADNSAVIAERIEEAADNKTAVRIKGGGSKTFYGNEVSGEELDTSIHCGIIEYQPSELVMTARSGTRLSEVIATLEANNQMLAFEPPLHTSDATFGGAIATGLSGPRRAFAGAARDFVLGTRIINGKGEIIKFGGQVMKNVAGYDASRLMVGAQGTLGVLLDISVKVLPIAETEITLTQQCDEQTAQAMLNRWISQGHPVTASCLLDNKLTVRLSSTDSSIAAASEDIGGSLIDNEFWDLIRDQQHEFFQQQNLWRVSLPPACEAIAADRPQLTEWAGALRWIVSEQPLYELAATHGGHATRYDINGQKGGDCFQTLNAPMLALHRRIKQAFDPGNILNIGRLYQGL